MAQGYLIGGTGSHTGAPSSTTSPPLARGKRLSCPSPTASAPPAPASAALACRRGRTGSPCTPTRAPGTRPRRPRSGAFKATA